MRIGALWQFNSAANYRAASPLTMLAHRGHEVLLPPENGLLPDKPLASCDAVLIYRRWGAQTSATIRRLKEAGVAIVWDTDDDFLHVPQSRRLRRETGGKNGRQIFADVLNTAKHAHVVTTTTETLAEVLRGSGLRDVRPIENYLMDNPRVPRRRRGRGLTVGWIAGLEHHADAVALGIPQALRLLQERHPELEVTCVGVDLGLRERYRHASFVPFPRLGEVMADFDIGIAPLIDTPFNRARSNIKVKEYAASGVPWLASRATPYAGLGERQGGRLVGDNEWFDALNDLIRDAAARDWLSKAGEVWSRQQTMASAVGQYESLFSDVIEQATGRRPAEIVRSVVDTPMGAQTPGSGRFAVKIPQRMVGPRRS